MPPEVNVVGGGASSALSIVSSIVMGNWSVILALMIYAIGIETLMDLISWAAVVTGLRGEQVLEHHRQVAAAEDALEEYYIEKRRASGAGRYLDERGFDDEVIDEVLG